MGAYANSNISAYRVKKCINVFDLCFLYFSENKSHKLVTNELHYLMAC